MSNQWTFLNEANRGVLRRVSTADGPVACAAILRSLRRQLALRFEKRSLVYADDGSQKLYDRWEEREVWAWVPTVPSPVYSIEGVGEFSPREVAWILRADAISLDVPVAMREATLGMLAMLKGRIEETIEKGAGESDHVLEVLAAEAAGAAREIGLAQVLLPLDGGRGIAFVYGADDRFRGGLEVSRKDGAWLVVPLGQLGGVAMAGGDDSGLAVVGAPAGCSTAPGYSVHSSSLDALNQVRTWIDDTLRKADARRDGMPKYDVAISFAGEDRPIAEEIAARLTLRGYRVFYDAYERADLWGKDLYQHLASVYTDQAVFCIVLISRHYSEKLWTKHELRSAQARAFRESREYVLPVKLDDIQLPGVPETIGYVALDQVGYDGLVNLLCEKLDTVS